MHRHIRRLRLTCQRESDGRHGRVLLEDAMRTASLDDDTRFIVVRQLKLGRMSPRASATEWSRKLESTYRAVQPAAVHYADSEAGQAAAVYFNNRHEPWLALADRTAKGEPCLDWFWRSAVPTWRPPHTTETTLQLCFRTLAEQGGLALTLKLALRLKTRGVLPTLLRYLKTPDFETLRSELKGLPAPQSPAASPESATEVEREFFSFWGVADIRTRWLAAVGAADGANFLLHVPTLATPLAGLVEQVVLTNPPPVPHAPISHASPTPVRPSPTPLHTPPRVRVFGDETFFTNAGGLFFTLPLLARAGFADQVEHLSAADGEALPWHLLRVIARLARTPDDDPLVVALGATPAVAVRLAHWLLATHRHSLRATGLSLRQLVSRPALIRFSPTHIDVFFRPADADIRIRRAGLDINHGWVPWLGRVVSFHFSRED